MPTASKQANVKESYSYNPPTGTDPLGEFEQNHRSYQLFREQGLDKIGPFPELGKCDHCGAPDSYQHSVLDESIFLRLRQFLNNVDPSKGPIEKKVIRLERRKDVDGEHLVIHCDWSAKDYLGNDISVDGVKEGIYNEPKTRTQLVRNKAVRTYQNWVAKYDIPFSAKAVDDALEGQDAESVIYMARHRTTRDDTLSLEQFKDKTWNEIVEISKTGKGLNR